MSVMLNPERIVAFPRYSYGRDLWSCVLAVCVRVCLVCCTCMPAYLHVLFIYLSSPLCVWSVHIVTVAGFSCAYLIFISENVSNVLPALSK